ETWNVTKIGYQLKQVRERLAKGLVDKGVLRTEKRNFLLFDMATHPVADSSAKEELVRRVRETLLARHPPPRAHSVRENLARLRTVSAVCASYAANVLDNALSGLPHDAREYAYSRVDETLAEYSVWPPGSGDTAYGGRNESATMGDGEDAEKVGSGREVVSAVLCVFTKVRTRIVWTSPHALRTALPSENRSATAR
ncbi:MAG: vacuolar protein sorting-associated protein, partial [Olpidium bornovanus]